MSYTAKVPDYLFEKLPEVMNTPEQKALFAALYRATCGDAGVDMADIHELDSSYYNVALYVAAYQMHEMTGRPEYYNIMYGLEDIANETAMLEGIQIDELKESRLYFVPAQVFAHAAAIGYLPDSKPVDLPYCNTYQEAQKMLAITPSQQWEPSGKYGAGDKMPSVPPVGCIYTVWAGPERVQMLESQHNDMMHMFARGVINPKTVVAVDFTAMPDVLHDARVMHEDVAYGSKPKHESVRREMDMRINAMDAFQASLGKTPALSRENIQMYGRDNATFRMCFSKDGFVVESPFTKTFPERVMQLTLRELRNVCNAETMRHADQLKDGFLQEFNGPIPSMQTMVRGLAHYLEDFKKTAEPSDQYNVGTIASSAQTIVNILAQEKAESLLGMDYPLSVDQRDYLKAARGLVPDQLRNEFVLRAADEMQRGMSNEAAVRLACRAMAKEASENGSPIMEDRMTAAGENAGMQYALYKDAMETEEVEV